MHGQWLNDSQITTVNAEKTRYSRIVYNADQSYVNIKCLKVKVPVSGARARLVDCADFMCCRKGMGRIGGV